ncbi:hypothetical protein CHARACLAT_006563 [Characodon lateralis]|uniref:Uncharacterized protein n=1 Tax=Characodon lateralis TaxID=208331 RepID=A0ABU7F346_9TELE|nr:hypothetical protein [Characodon lateralis]
MLPIRHDRLSEMSSSAVSRGAVCGTQYEKFLQIKIPVKADLSETTELITHLFKLDPLAPSRQTIADALHSHPHAASLLERPVKRWRHSFKVDTLDQAADCECSA